MVGVDAGRAWGWYIAEMKSAAEKFHEAMKDLGGRLDLSGFNAEAQANWNGQLSYFRDQVIAARNAIPHLPPIYIDYVDDLSVNAVAIKWNGEYFVGLYSGLIIAINILFMRMLSTGTLFPHIGDTSKESSISPEGYLDRRNILKPPNKYIRPVDPVRFEFAQWMRFWAMHFILNHELVHIVNGHVDFIEEEYGLNSIGEGDLVGEDPDYTLVRQTLEMDADWGSFLQCMTLIDEKLEQRKANPPVYHPGYNSFPQVVCDFTCSVGSFFRLFGDDTVAGTDLADTYHPPFRFRQQMVYEAILRTITKREQTESEAAQKLMRLATMEVERASTVLSGEKHSVVGVRETQTETFMQYQGRLRDSWVKCVRPKLESYTFGHLW